MTAHGWLTLITCAGELAFFALAATRGARSPLGRPLALLSVVLFGSNLASLGYDVSGNRVWNWIDVSISPLTTPLALHFLVSFFGRRRQLAWLLWVAYAAFGLLSLASALAFGVPAMRGFAGSALWSELHLAGVAPVVALGVVLFVIHLRSTASPEEKQRTRLLLLAFAVLAVLGTTDLWEHAGLSVPRLGNLGALIFTGLLSVVALRLRLFGRDLSSSQLVFSSLLGALAISVYIAVFQFFAANAALTVLATVTLGWVLLAASWPARAARAARRERMSRLALMGRFSSQMAHDLKNPLAALKGAVQFLAEEHARGSSLAEHGQFVSLLVEQVRRVERVVDAYQRLSRVEPVLQEVEVNELVRRVLALQPFAAGDKVAVRAELGNPLPACRADPDLIAAAVENLIRNAYEAMPEGGTLTVRTDGNSGSAIELSVEDTGRGMDSRTAERVFDEFFTTKATGSGLGLSFVRRVAEAHQGEVSLFSREGVGTTVKLRLPARG